MEDGGREGEEGEEHEVEGADDMYKDLFRGFEHFAGNSGEENGVRR